ALETPVNIINERLGAKSGSVSDHLVFGLVHGSLYTQNNYSLHFNKRSSNAEKLDDNWILHQGNSSSRSTIIDFEFLFKLDVATPLYRPYMEPEDFFLLPKMKNPKMNSTCEAGRLRGGLFFLDEVL
ncbi:hypothetical protein TNCT_189011, partial [Trichonephila clavata]